MTEPLPRQLHDFRPARGLIKGRCEDFLVEEIPLYPFDGHGTHTFFRVEKTGLSSGQAVAELARALHVRRLDIGFAGQKDARAITRQWLSVEHVDPQVVAALDLPHLRILEVARHGNKLRLGHLKANRFAIRVRESEPARVAELRQALAELVRQGVPNYFGGQRFGHRGDNWAIGRALLRHNSAEALDWLLGRPREEDRGGPRRARMLYEDGDYEAAAHAWPRAFQLERRALRALARSGGKPARGLAAVDRSMRTFFVAAYQSYLFNRIVAARLPQGLPRLCDGDLAWIHASSAVFRVEDSLAEQPRADRFEISPTGPLFGYRMTTASGAPGALEAALLAQEELAPNAFRAPPLRAKGLRRPLRYQPAEASLQLGADPQGPYLELTFVLPRGSYATALLRELFAEAAPHAEDADVD